MNNIIDFKDVSFSTNNLYNQVNNVKFSLKEGEKLFIDSDFGNGAEELFRLLLGLEKPKKGKILINESLITQVDFKNLNLLYITKEPQLFDNKSVLENIKYFIKLRVKNKRDVEQILEDSLEKFDLKDICNKKANELTNFERIKVVLARSFYRRPQIILIENIFTNLNEEEQLETIKSLKTSFFMEKTTVILWSTKEVYELLNGFRYKKMEYGSLN